MSLFFYISGVAAIFVSLGHSILSEKKLIGPLLAEAGDTGVLRHASTRRVLRGVFHLPSVAWSFMGLMTIYLAQQGTMNIALLYFFVPVYIISGLANLFATRVIHPGWILLFIAAAALAFGFFT